LKTVTAYYNADYKIPILIIPPNVEICKTYSSTFTTFFNIFFKRRLSSTFFDKKAFKDRQAALPLRPNNRQYAQFMHNRLYFQNIYE